MFVVLAHTSTQAVLQQHCCAAARCTSVTKQQNAHRGLTQLFEKRLHQHTLLLSPDLLGLSPTPDNKKGWDSDEIWATPGYYERDTYFLPTRGSDDLSVDCTCVDTCINCAQVVRAQASEVFHFRCMRF